MTLLEGLIETCGIGARSDNSLTSVNSIDDAHENNDYEMSEQRKYYTCIVFCCWSENGYFHQPFTRIKPLKGRNEA